MSEIKVSAALAPSEGCEEESGPHLPPNFWWFAGNISRSLSWRSSPISAFVFTWLSPCVCLSPRIPVWYGHQSYWIKGPPYPVGPHLCLIDYIYNGPISKEGNILRFRGLGLQQIHFEVGSIQPITDGQMVDFVRLVSLLLTEWYLQLCCLIPLIGGIYCKFWIIKWRIINDKDSTYCTTVDLAGFTHRF